MRQGTIPVDKSIQFKGRRGNQGAGVCCLIVFGSLIDDTN